MPVDYDALREESKRYHQEIKKRGELKFSARVGKEYSKGSAGHIPSRGYGHKKTDEQRFTEALAVSDAERKKGNFYSAAKHLAMAASYVSEDLKRWKNSPEAEEDALKSLEAIDKRMDRVINQAEDKKEKPQLYGGTKYYPDDMTAKMREIHKFYEAQKEKKLARESTKPSKLESTAATTAIIATVGGMIFSSVSMTGHVIAGASAKANSIVGAVFLIIGLIAGAVWLRSRKK
jgi:hypothetical protein